LIAAGDPALLARTIETEMDSPVRTTAMQRAKTFSADTALEKYGMILGLSRAMDNG
jgi:hypothetical protein